MCWNSGNPDHAAHDLDHPPTRDRPRLSAGEESGTLSDLKRSLKTLKREGFRRVQTLESVAAVDAVELERDKLWNDRRHETGPFDIIGDVHGCADELEQLLLQLGFVAAGGSFRHPQNRKAVFVGDLVDRLRSRGLNRKRGLALREFALGLEALHRFVENEPLYRVSRVRVRRAGYGERTRRSTPVGAPCVA